MTHAKTGLTGLEENDVICSRPPLFSSARFPLWDRACEIMTKEETLPSICLISEKCFLSTRETSSRENSLLACVPHCQ